MVKGYYDTSAERKPLFLISAFNISYKDCAFIFEYCLNAFVQFIVHLTWLFTLMPSFNLANYN